MIPLSSSYRNDLLVFLATCSTWIFQWKKLRSCTFPGALSKRRRGWNSKFLDFRYHPTSWTKKLFNQSTNNSFTTHIFLLYLPDFGKLSMLFAFRTWGLKKQWINTGFIIHFLKAIQQKRSVIQFCDTWNAVHDFSFNKLSPASSHVRWLNGK